MEIQKNDLKKVDLTKVKVEVEFDKIVELDIHKDIANIIHKCTSELEIDEIAREIFHDGSVELSENNIQAITEIIQKSNLLVSFKKAVINLLKQ